MAVVIVILIGLLIWAISLSKMDALSKSVIIFYIGFWGLVLFLSSLNLLHFNPIRNRTYYMLLLHLFAFVIGYILVKIPKSHALVGVKSDYLGKQVEHLVNSKWYRILLIILTLYALSLFAIYFQKIMIYNSLADLRSEYYDGSDMYGASYRIINQWLLKPFSIFATPLFAYLCFTRRDKYCWLLGLFLLVYNTLSAGRFGYVKIAIGFLYVIVCLAPALRKNFRNWLTTAIVFGGIFFLIMITTVARLDSFGSASSMTETGKEIMGENALLSITQPVSGLDYALDHNYLKRVGGYNWGGMTLTSIQRFVNPFFRKLGMGFEVSASKLNFKQEEYIDIGYTRNQNALYTSVLWYFLDFGWLGVFLFPFLFGIGVRKVIKLLYKYQTVVLAILLGFFFQLMLFSVFDYYITGEADLLFVLLLWLTGTATSTKRQRFYIPIVIYCALALFFTQL